MFTNPFLKKDPLVEAVRQAQQDGEMRRLAESMTNDLFDVYSRKAVVREYLNDYDFALEEAYKCMKEAEKMADKDYDGDGDVETSKKEVWGSRLRAAKASGKYKGPVDEEQIDEISTGLARRYLKKAKGQTDDLGTRLKMGLDKSTNRQNSIRLAKAKMTGDTYKKYNKGHEEGREREPAKREPKVLTKEEALDEVKGTAAVQNMKHRDFKETRHPNKGAVTKAPVPGVSIAEKWEGSKEDKSEDKALAKKHGMTMKQWEKSAADKKHDAKEKMDEAAYSAKAARAGKDIAKRGKMFGKIAKKAGVKYGSMERGKKVAGAILAKIRAKHMKEDSSFNAALESGKSVNEVVSAADLAKSGLTLGQYMNRASGKTAVKGGHNDPTSSNFKGPATSSTAGQLAKSGIGNMSTGGGVNRTLPGKLGSSSMPSSPSGTSAAPRAMPSSLSGSSAPATAKQPGDDASAFVKSQGVGTSASKTDLASAASKIASQGPVTSPVSGPGPTSTPPTASATAPTPSKKEAGAIPKTVAESVQVGDNKYRIV